VGQDQQVAIVFADVVGSTQLYENLGDERARETVQSCLNVMKRSTEEYGGTVIKTMGDEVMSTFPSADDAMNAASQMQQRITNNPAIGGGTPVAIRIVPGGISPLATARCGPTRAVPSAPFK